MIRRLKKIERMKHSILKNNTKELVESNLGDYNGCRRVKKNS